ncbi:MAG: helix-turn-helix transcriptional regulator [Pirellulaceae bacterium]|nr:helix-turn-helix transcriptional regulator [Planctomycetaceae bacterium]MDG2381619.1 helix-turn-helix transcriptional regulator [Pirellulaceae bacterium]
MSIAPDNLSVTPIVSDYPRTPELPENDMKHGTLHRIREVRQQQGVSLRTVAKQMKLTMSKVREQEKPDSDLKLSDLLRWQNILEVPLVDLLQDIDLPLSRPVMERAQMIKLMKTAVSIAEQPEQAKSNGVKRLAKMLTDQLVNIMPELSEVGGWHSVGQQRSRNEYGRIFERRLCDDFSLPFPDE